MQTALLTHSVHSVLAGAGRAQDKQSAPSGYQPTAHVEHVFSSAQVKQWELNGDALQSKQSWFLAYLPLGQEVHNVEVQAKQ